MARTRYTPGRLAILGLLLAGSLAVMGWIILTNLSAARRRGAETGEPQITSQHRDSGEAAPGPPRPR